MVRTPLLMLLALLVAADAASTLAKKAPPAGRKDATFVADDTTIFDAVDACCPGAETPACAPYGPMGNWDVGNVTYMGSLFEDMPTCQLGDLNFWDVSSVTDFRRMFWNTGFDFNTGDWRSGSPGIDCWMVDFQIYTNSAPYERLDLLDDGDGLPPQGMLHDMFGSSPDFAYNNGGTGGNYNQHASEPCWSRNRQLGQSYFDEHCFRQDLWGTGENCACAGVSDINGDNFNIFCGGGLLTATPTPTPPTPPSDPARPHAAPCGGTAGPPIPAYLLIRSGITNLAPAEVCTA